MLAISTGTKLMILEPASITRPLEIEAGAEIKAVVISPDSKYLAIATKKNVQIYNRAGRPTGKIGIFPQQSAFITNDRLLIYGNNKYENGDRDVSMFDITGKRIADFHSRRGHGFSEYIEASSTAGLIALHEKGPAFTSIEEEARVFEINIGAEYPLPATQRYWTVVRFQPNGKLMALRNDRYHIGIFNSQDLQQCISSSNDYPWTGVRFSENGEIIALKQGKYINSPYIALQVYGEVHLFSSDGKLLARITGNWDGMDLSPDGKSLVVSQFDQNEDIHSPDRLLMCFDQFGSMKFQTVGQMAGFTGDGNPIIVSHYPVGPDKKSGGGVARTVIFNRMDGSEIASFKEAEISFHGDGQYMTISSRRIGGQPVSVYDLTANLRLIFPDSNPGNIRQWGNKVVVEEYISGESQISFFQ